MATYTSSTAAGNDETVAPAIYVASLSDYNNGLLHGCWISALLPESAIGTAIQDMLTASPWAARTGEPAEEWAILDHEGFTEPRPDAHESIADVVQLARRTALDKGRIL